MAAESQATLLIADKPAAVEQLRSLLGGEVRVLTAADATSASQMLETEDVQLLLADQLLPGGGLELITESRTRFPHIVRMVFARDEAELRNASVPLQQGVLWRVVTKPVRPSDFKSTIRNAAEVARLRADRRLLRDQLNKAGRLRLQALALLAAELRTPVTYVTGMLELMRAVPDEAKREERLGVFEQRLKGLAATVDGVVRLLETDSADRLPRAPMAFGKVLSDVVEAHRPAAEARGLELNADIAEGLPSVLGVKPLLADALSQLLRTAIYVSAPGSAVEVSAVAPSPAEIVVTVTDTGEMVPDSDLPYLFEPYYFSRHPRRPDGDAQGLHPGLAAVRKFVQLAGGRVELKKTGPGGSVFEVHLPVNGGPPTAGSDEVTARLPTTK